MHRLTLFLVAICHLALGISTTHAAVPTEQEMADRIDRHLASAWAAEKIQPAAEASDAEFLRRAWLDLAGVIPAIHDRGPDGDFGVRGFLQDKRPDKRSRLIDHLLSKKRHAVHFRNLWMELIIPPDSNARRFGRDGDFKNWLRHQFAENVPYDQMVSELLLTGNSSSPGNPTLFYTALELKPDRLAAKSSRLLLGVQIECAQCHDHPFDRWKQKDFWSYAAFFARVQRSGSGATASIRDAGRGDVKLPDMDEVVLPQFLGGAVSEDVDTASRRVRLTQWLTSKENPYFSRASVNRIWALLFGRGIVDPVDDFGQHNSPSHPELLNELSDYFSETGFDMHRLIRTLARTKAYQRSSKSSPGAEERPELFARMAIKNLTADQLYDCLAEATRRLEPVSALPTPTTGFRSIDQKRQAFLTKFAAPGQAPTEYSSGIPHALSLMNGQLVREATDLAKSDILIALNAPFFTDEQRVDVLFMSTLSRLPHADERTKFIAYVKQGGAEDHRKEAIGDILWALLNSAEFVLNH